MRASYRRAVEWIAANDNAGDNEDVDALSGYLSVLLVADLFDKFDSETVARDVYRERQRRAARAGKAGDQ
jgi:hypothetical protein